ncbi:hypothetical protein SDC9_67066 [bioreactor metagenome]|uniref:Uncharacterized protein n=1 Tax=bioreactor metagenome TaxID=1076179 RepID=A0A644XYA0_9ZZZZ
MGNTGFPLLRGRDDLNGPSHDATGGKDGPPVGKPGTAFFQGQEGGPSGPALLEEVDAGSRLRESLHENPVLPPSEVGLQGRGNGRRAGKGLGGHRHGNLELSEAVGRGEEADGFGVG